MGRRIGLLLFFLLQLLLNPPEVRAETSLAEISSFSDALFDEKDYFRAVTEYKRLIHLFPHTPQAKKAAFSPL